MNLAADLRLVLLALRDRLADPDRIAEVGLAWSPADGPLSDYLAARGVLTPDQLDRLGRTPAETPVPTAHPVETPTGAGGSPGTLSFAVLAQESSPTGTFHRTVDPPAAATAPNVPTPVAAPGDRYRRLRLHRTGGLGQVWLAHDSVVGRDVALKTLKPERSARAGAAARFLREARVTGRLEHPGIVPLYDLSAADDAGGPWYVMRFVSGRTLAEATEDYHDRRRDGKPDALEFAGLLDAYVAVCRAVAFAHSREVLHRDLKGQNVVLGEFGEVFLLDWGLAKPTAGTDDGPSGVVTGAAPATVEGAVAGTPAYMAPELPGGAPATTASDVYSLGAVLYSILTGKPPAQGSSAAEVLRQVATAAPPPPRALNPEAPRALEAICLKAMARSAADRYPSAEALATEVRRWLADEPVLAFRESVAVRAVRWARRRRTAVAAAAAVLVTATAALTVTTALVWREERATAAARTLAESERGRAEFEKDRAVENFRTARTLAVDLGDKIAALETGRFVPQEIDQTRGRALKVAIEGFERFEAADPTDAVMRRQMAMLHRFAANVARSANDFPTAEASYQAALRDWEELAGRSPEDPSLPRLRAETLWDYAAYLTRAGRLADAATTIDQAAGLTETLRGSVPDAHFQRTMGTALLERAGVEYLRGQFAQAEASARQAVGLYDQLRAAPAGQTSPVDALLAAMAVNRAAASLRDAGRPADALPLHDDAVARLDKYAKAQSGRDSAYWSARVRLERAATLATIPGRRAGAKDEYSVAIRSLDWLVGDFPVFPLYREWLAAALLGRGEIASAEADLTRARDLLERLVAQYREVPDYRGVLGRTCLATGRQAANPKDAADWFAKAKFMIDSARKRDPDNFFHRRAAEELERAMKPAGP